MQVRFQEEKASAAAAALEHFVADVVRQLRWAHPPEWLADSTSLEPRLKDYGKLLRELPAVTEIRYLDAAGRERIRVGQLTRTVVDGGDDHAAVPEYRVTRGGQPYF